MAFVHNGSRIGMQPLTNTETTQNHPLGTIVTGWDATLGEGEFIYLKGVGSTIVGSGVVYDDSFQTALASLALNVGRPIAIALSANIANRTGWYQISGNAEVAKASTVAFTTKGAGVGITSGLAVAAASGLILVGGVVASSAVSADATVNIMINRPTGPSSD